MKIEVLQRPNHHEVKIEGRIDANTSPELEKIISDLINSGHENVVVDFAQVNYISSSGLRVFLVAAKLLDPKGIKLKLINMPDFIKEVFDIAGFTVIFEFD